MSKHLIAGVSSKVPVVDTRPSPVLDPFLLPSSLSKDSACSDHIRSTLVACPVSRL